MCCDYIQIHLIDFFFLFIRIKISYGQFTIVSGDRLLSTSICLRIVNGHRMHLNFVICKSVDNIKSHEKHVAAAKHIFSLFCAWFEWWTWSSTECIYQSTFVEHIELSDQCM